MKILKRYICSTTVHAYEDTELEVAEQKYSSAKTAINGKQGKLPAIFKMVKFPSSSLVLDYGGGTIESEQVANAYLSQFDCEDVVYDPYNKSSAEQSEAIKKIRQNGGADIAVCSNVLNVIAEESARIALLKNIKKLTKSGAPVYFTVYEGSKEQQSRGARMTKEDQYQNFRGTSTYLEEVQSVFPDAYMKNSKLIAATNS